MKQLNVNAVRCSHYPNDPRGPRWLFELVSLSKIAFPRDTTDADRKRVVGLAPSVGASGRISASWRKRPSREIFDNSR